MLSSKDKLKRKIQMLDLLLSVRGTQGTDFSQRVKPAVFFLKNAGSCEYNQSAEELEN